MGKNPPSSGGGFFAAGNMDNNALRKGESCMRDNMDKLNDYVGNNGFHCTFYEDESEFDGNDFEYIFMFDIENAEKLRAAMSAGGTISYADMHQWIKDNIRDQETGSDFRFFCVEHDIHGIRWVHEDYPEGINYVDEF